jgi:hypothetical protein
VGKRIKVAEYKIFLYDGQSGQLAELTIAADGGSYAPALSADGTAVAFSSLASTLVPGDTDTFEDVFLWAPAAPEYLVFLPLAVKGN